MVQTKLLPVTLIVALMVSGNSGFHFSTVIAVTKVKNNSFKIKNFIAKRQRPRSVPFSENNPIIVKEKQTINAPESALSTNNNDYNDALALAETRTLQYLSSMNNNDQNRKPGVGKFHLYGWRWHTMSLIRETERLAKLAQSFQNSSSSLTDQSRIADLKKSVGYVIDFNLKGMSRVENEVMIPFLRRQFDEHDDVKGSLKTIIDHLEMEQQNLSELGLQISSKLAESTAIESQIVLDDIIEKSNEIASTATSMLELKNNVIIPAMTQLVPERKQKTTISSIMSSLGVLDSRLHLVGFHEAIKDNEKELRLWNENIPLVARRVIPMWKQSQYDPRAFALQNV